MMKLIDAIVKTIPRGSIPASAEFFAQDCDEYHETFSFSKVPALTALGEYRSIGGTDRLLPDVPVATDAATAVITRAELMEAYDNEHS